ncbi:BREX-2 system adenine-specific DNA-methyltransferase PglX [Sorangium sp. So ce216]
MAGKRKKGADESLTTALARLLEKTLLPDLTARAKTPAVAAVLAEQHAREKAESRTADPLAEWTPRWLEQIGAAWVLSCVFLRTLEDRGLVRHRRIAGEGAVDAEQLFFEIAPSLTARDYLLTAFREVARHAGAEDLLGPGRNPAFRLSPSNEGARALLDFFRQPDEGGKGLRWGFAGSDTRFLGDLYQDLSASVRERYALLQTPVFVEEFILDLTLEPAIATFGLEETHVIDPTCGSGHFLLGAFERICEHRMRTAPGLDPKEHALAALGQVHGVDLNPYAAAIARFRLTLAYLAKAGLGSLAEVPKRLPIEVVVADSLLHGVVGTTRRFAELGGQRAKAWGQPMFELEDPEAADRVFGRKYQAVVGNPPYITCKDAALREAYRERYVSAAGKYALAAPFTERFFQLGVDGGYVGLINANSFMKREFGKKLIEEVLRHLDVTRIIDTSGAYIPGHGTPTVLLFGRNQTPVGTTVRAVLGKRGEPTTPELPECGVVWSAIATHFNNDIYEDEFISVSASNRNIFAKHPWSIGGGGASGLKALLEERCACRLRDTVEDIGFASFTGLDNAFIVPPHVPLRLGAGRLSRPMVTGESVRDWSCAPQDSAIAPYDTVTQEPLPLAVEEQWAKFLWRFRACAEGVTGFGGRTRKEDGQSWWQWYRWQADRYRTKFRISFAFVATHNHFVLDRGGKVFTRTAPIITLPEGATEEDHLALLGYLNSSTACFWMKQVCHAKTNHTDDRPETFEPGTLYYEFTSTLLQPLPIPSSTQRSRLALLATALEQLEDQSVPCSPVAVAQEVLTASSPPEQLLRAAEDHDIRLRDRRVALQEDVDWLVYGLFGLCDASLGDPAFLKDGTLSPKDRAFVSADAPSHLSNEQKVHWFARKSSTMQSSMLALIESAEYKRRWLGVGRGSFAHEARTFRERCIDALVDIFFARIEAALDAASNPISVRKLLSELQRGQREREIFDWMCGGEDSEAWFRTRALSTAVPYLAALRYTPEGLENRAAWEHTWDLQRREDAGEKLSAPIPVPPKYDAKDFRDPNYYRLRGKLDVPKERFISYPGAEKDDDPSPLFGWAGWNHLERATALAGLYQERKTEDGWGADRLTPLLAGLLELVPWLKQWHNEMNEEFGERLGDYYERYVDTEARALGLSLDALRAWRPEARGRKGKAKRAAP